MNDNKICKTPFIKWTGSKRTQAKKIVDCFPKKFDVYYESFLGGGSVLHELLNRIYTGEISCSKIICTDINKDLIMLFDMLRHRGLREVLYDFYRERYAEMKKYSGYEEGRITPEQVAKMQEYYNQQRDKYNSWIAGDDFPLERAMTFFWLTRTSYNGLVRYNSKGLFNAPFHVNGRMGISPDKLRKVIDGWALVLDSFEGKGGEIFFLSDDYANPLKYVDAQRSTVVYMDPPYENSKGMYELPENFSKERLLETIAALNKKMAKVLLSYNGKDGDIDGTSRMEKWYVTHKYIYSGSSSYRRIRLDDMTDKWNIVRDSLYMNF